MPSPLGERIWIGLPRRRRNQERQPSFTNNCNSRRLLRYHNRLGRLCLHTPQRRWPRRECMRQMDRERHANTNRRWATSRPPQFPRSSHRLGPKFRSLRLFPYHRNTHSSMALHITDNCHHKTLRQLCSPRVSTNKCSRLATRGYQCWPSIITLTVLHLPAGSSSSSSTTTTTTTNHPLLSKHSPNRSRRLPRIFWTRTSR